MEPDLGKIKGIGNIKEIWKGNKKNVSVMPTHVECGNRPFNWLALLFKTFNVFFPWAPLLCILLINK